MTTEDVLWLLVSGAALGIAARYFLALNIQFHTAVYMGVLVLLGGPSLVRQLGDYFADWTTLDIVIGAVVALVLAVALRVAALQARRQYFKRRRPGGGALS